MENAASERLEFLPRPCFRAKALLASGAEGRFFSAVRTTRFAKIVRRFFPQLHQKKGLTGALETRKVCFAFTKKLAANRERREIREASRNEFAHSLTHSVRRHMKTDEWKTYRTRFLVKAKQLSSNLSFIDSLGRQHSGRKGDYLVESWEGVVSIAPRQIFEDIYVAMAPKEDELSSTNQRRIRPVADTRTRKLPQPCRDGRAFSQRADFL